VHNINNAAILQSEGIILHDHFAYLVDSEGFVEQVHEEHQRAKSKQLRNLDDLFDI